MSQSDCHFYCVYMEQNFQRFWEPIKENPGLFFALMSVELCLHMNKACSTEVVDCLLLENEIK